MLNKSASVFLVIALVSTMCSLTAFGQSQFDSATKVSRAEDSPAPGNRSEARPNEKLKADVAKLVTDARAGKIKPAPKSQIQPTKSNNLSKTAKIAIVVGIVVAVTAIIVYKSLEWDCKARCVL